MPIMIGSYASRHALTARRAQTTATVEAALATTAHLTALTPALLRANPAILPVLRMTTAPPLARDRLIGLASVAPILITTMEKQQRLPPRLPAASLDLALGKISALLTRLVDRDVFPWLESGQPPGAAAVHRAATIVADRLCGAVADPIIRNAQEQRQLAAMRDWLEQRGYTFVGAGTGLRLTTMPPGAFAFRLNVPVTQPGRAASVNIPVDVAVMPHHAQPGRLPVFIEAKSAGDFTNTNKRRKEEATKVAHLRATYGPQVHFILFLCGYFDSGYLGYEAAEGIDWVWEHRIDDLALLGL